MAGFLNEAVLDAPTTPLGEGGFINRGPPAAPEDAPRESVAAEAPRDRFIDTERLAPAPDQGVDPIVGFRPGTRTPITATEMADLRRGGPLRIQPPDMAMSPRTAALNPEPQPGEVAPDYRSVGKWLGERDPDREYAWLAPGSRPKGSNEDYSFDLRGGVTGLPGDVVSGIVDGGKAINRVVDHALKNEDFDPLDVTKGLLTLYAGTPFARSAGVLAAGPAARSLVPEAAREAVAPIRAYHGSPHAFDAFDASKIGTGEGAQAYGHGLYFAEHEGTARSYRDALSGPSFSPPEAPQIRLPPDRMAEAAVHSLVDSPALANVDRDTLRSATNWVAEEMASGRTPAELQAQMAQMRFPSDGAAAAHREALNYFSGLNFEPGVPTVGGKPYNSADPAHRAAFYLDTHGGDVPRTLKAIDAETDTMLDRIDEAQKSGRGVPVYYDEALQRLGEIRDHLESGKPTQPYKVPGHMYEVGIKADPARFLHWDKPLSEQSPEVQAALKPWTDAIRERLATRAPGGGRYLPGEAADAARVADDVVGSMTGESLYNQVTDQHGLIREGASAKASEALRDAGIPGIRYLDAGSRGPGAGTHNYVVFSPETIDILRKYGIAGLIGGGAAAAADRSQGGGDAKSD